MEPPAPYVTETNVGRSASSSRIARQSCRSPSSVFGGKNSKENDRSPAASSSRTVGARPGSDATGDPRTWRFGYPVDARMPPGDASGLTTVTTISP